jgi:hypothetical protein
MSPIPSSLVFPVVGVYICMHVHYLHTAHMAYIADGIETWDGNMAWKSINPSPPCSSLSPRDLMPTGTCPPT